MNLIQNLDLGNIKEWFEIWIVSVCIWILLIDFCLFEVATCNGEFYGSYAPSNMLQTQTCIRVEKSQIPDRYKICTIKIGQLKMFVPGLQMNLWSSNVLIFTIGALDILPWNVWKVYSSWTFWYRQQGCFQIDCFTASVLTQNTAKIVKSCWSLMLLSTWAKT